MCYSANVSLITFLIGITGSGLCFNVGTVEYKIVGIFFAFVVLMQLIEYLLWKHQICDSYNQNLTKTAMIINHLQPIILIACIFLFNKQNVSPKMLCLLVFYTVIISLYSFNFLKSSSCTLKSSTPGNSHLIWDWNGLKYSNLVYAIFLVSLILIGIWGFPTTSSGVLFAAICFFSFMISRFIYGKQGVIGAVWCFFAAFAPLFYLLKRVFI
jgi:hypothetical protein